MSLLVKMLRQLYLERSTGTLVASGGAVLGHLLEGEAHLSPDHRLARDAAAAPMAPEVARNLARRWRRHDDARFDGGTARIPEDPVGPLSTLELLVSLATDDRDTAELTAMLGGPKARMRGRGDTPALRQLRGLDEAQSRILPRLESPTTLDELARLTGLPDAEVTLAAVRLWTVGLAETQSIQPEAQEGAGSGVVTPRLLERFSDRIAEMLELDPLDLDPESHKTEVSRLFKSHPRLDHFQLLGLAYNDGDAELAAAFRRLAARVHPMHAKPLGLEHRADLFRTLFERVTEAYLVLSDPRRRAHYLESTGVRAHQKVEVSEDERRRETVELAAQYYRESLHYLSDESMDYMSAVNILQEAVRLDPQPEYYARLAAAQSRNPQWRAKAAASYRKAIEGDPDNPGLYVGLGQVLQATGDAGGARDAYHQALERAPGHPAASEGLERLGFAGTAQSLGRGLRSLLGGS